MSGNAQVVAPFYDDDTVDDQQMVLGTIAGAHLPQAIVSYAQQAETQEGEATALVVVVDMSGSLSGKAQAVRKGLNAFREVLMKSHERRKMHIRVILFNNKWKAWEPHGPDVPFMTALKGDPHCLPEITEQVYYPSGTTMIYEPVRQGTAACELLAAALEKDGNDVRRVVVVVSDGFDNESAPGHREQLKTYVATKALSEKWSFQFYGFMDENLRDMMASNMGLVLHNDAEREALDLRIFQCVACENDPEVEQAMKRLDPQTVVGGMGFLKTMVQAFPSDPDTLMSVLGFRMSSSVLRASAGKIKAAVPLAAQNAVSAGAGSGAGDDDSFA